MGLFDTVKMNQDITSTFENDGFELTEEMIDKYKKSKITIKNGQIRSRDKYFCKNASIFDVTGMKLVWGDIEPNDVKDMQGVYYILSEHKSFWKIDETDVKGWNFRSKDPNSISPFKHLLPDFEPVILDLKYVKKNSIGRIINGEIQTSKWLIYTNYQ